MFVNVRVGLSDNTRSICLSRAATVLDLKVAVNREAGIHLDAQGILYDSKPIFNNHQLLNCILNERLDQFQVINIGERIQSVITQLKNEPINRVPEYFESLDSELKNNKWVVLAAVERHGIALQYASEELRGDRDFVLEAVKKNGLSLEYASEALKADYEVALEAVKEDWTSLQFVSDDLKDNRNVVLEAVKGSLRGGFKFASNNLRADRDFVLEAVKESGYVLDYVSDDLHADRDFILKVLTVNGSALEYVSDEFRADPDLLAIASR